MAGNSPFHRHTGITKFDAYPAVRIRQAGEDILVLAQGARRLERKKPPKAWNIDDLPAPFSP